MENEVEFLVLNDPIHDLINFSTLPWEEPVLAVSDVDDFFPLMEDDFVHDVVFSQPDQLLNVGDETVLAPFSQPPEEENLDDILAELLEDFNGRSTTGEEKVITSSSTTGNANDHLLGYGDVNDDMFLIKPSAVESIGEFSCEVVTPVLQVITSTLESKLDLAISMPAKKRRKWVVVDDDPVECEDYDKNVDDDRIFYEEEEEETRIDRGQLLLNSKNLVSERNRRKRLNQQLLMLRSIVPNITKMDKRSVLIDALSYLKNIQEKTERIKSDLEEDNKQRKAEVKNPPPHMKQHYFSSKSAKSISILPAYSIQISEIETEEMEDWRFVVKITAKGDPHEVGGRILQMIESTGVETTYASLENTRSQNMLVVKAFITTVRREGRMMTEDSLKEFFTSAAVRSGMTIHQEQI